MLENLRTGGSDDAESDKDMKQLGANHELRNRIKNLNINELNSDLSLSSRGAPAMHNPIGSQS